MRLTACASVLRGHRAVAACWAFSPGLRLNAAERAIPKFEVFEWEDFVIPAAKSVDDVWKSMSTGRRQSVRQPKGAASWSRTVCLKKSPGGFLSRWPAFMSGKGFTG